MKKRLLAMLLCVVLVLSCLAGCGKNDSLDDDNTPSANIQDPTEVTSSEPSKELDKLPLVDPSENVTLTIAVRGSSLTEDYKNNEFTKWVEEQTGINLEVIPYSSEDSEAVSQINLDINGGNKLPDIYINIRLDNDYRNQLGEDGYLVDLMPYFENDAYWFWDLYNQCSESAQANILNKGVDPANGALYAFPQYQEGTVDQLPYMGVINSQWLDTLGLDMPANVDEVYEVLKAFATQDPNQNGQIDELPFIIQEGGGWKGNALEWLINAFVYCNDETYFNATDGKIWVPYNTDEYRQALIYMNKLYSEGLISPMCFSLSGDAELMQVVSPSDGVAISGVAGGHPVLTFEVDNMIISQYSALPVLADETGLGGRWPVSPATLSYHTYITTDCENPELAFKLIDFLYSPEASFRARYGVLGVNWDWAKEGDVSLYGLPSVVQVLDDSAFTGQNSIIWHIQPPVIWPQVAIATVAAPNNGGFASLRSAIAKSLYTSAVATIPNEVYMGVNYTAEESEQYTEATELLWDYIFQSRALFITGTLNPNSDADWQTYLDTMEANGLSTAIKLTQAAYDRLMQD